MPFQHVAAAPYAAQLQGARPAVLNWVLVVSMTSRTGGVNSERLCRGLMASHNTPVFRAFEPQCGRAWIGRYWIPALGSKVTQPVALLPGGTRPSALNPAAQRCRKGPPDSPASPASATAGLHAGPGGHWPIGQRAQERFGGRQGTARKILSPPGVTNGQKTATP